MVARVLWVVARELLCDKGVVNVVAKVLYGCHIVAMWLLGCCGWLPGNCYVITRVLLM